MKTKIECTLTDKELIELAHKEIRKMCETGGGSFTMRVPANPNKDTDIILSEIIMRFEKVITPSGE